MSHRRLLPFNFNGESRAVLPLAAGMPLFHADYSIRLRWFMHLSITLFLCMIIPLNGQTLSGKVVDKNHGGIAEAAVRLILADVNCRSNPDGDFSFMENAVIPKPVTIHPLSDISSDVRSVAIYTLNGRKMDTYLPVEGNRILTLHHRRENRAASTQLLIRASGPASADKLHYEKRLQNTAADTLLVTHDNYLFRKLLVADVNGTIEPVMLKDIDDVIADYWEYLDGYYLRQNELPYDPFGFPTVDSLFASLSDPFTDYMTKTEGEQMMEALNHQTVGLGIRIDSVSDGYHIIEVFSGAPAYEAGLMEGDIIIAIDSIETAGIPFVMLIGLLQGEIGETVHLEIKRENQLKNIDVTREKYQLPSVYSDSINQSTILITITGFTGNAEYLIGGGTSDELGSALRKNIWADNVIIDLRHNGGGYLDEGIGCASWFMERGVELLHMQGREYNMFSGEFYTSDSSFYSTGQMFLFEKNIVMLADSFTASTSEAFIIMMKEVFPEIPVVGTTTYGKGIGQVVIMGPDSGMARITCIQLESLAGESWNRVGITPDYEVSEGEDPMEIALSLFGTMSKRRPGRFHVPVAERRSSIDFCVVDVK